MRIGVKIPTNGPLTSIDAIRDVSQAADELGYASIWVQDHVTRSPADAEHHFAMGAWDAWQRPIRPDFFEALATLAWVAAQTERVRLGTSALILPFRNPVWTAKIAATIDQLSGGRLILGVAVGGAYARRELASIGHHERGSRRGKIAEEWLDIIHGVWTEPVFDYSGEILTIEKAEVYPKPRQELPPIWIGGTSGYARDRAARRGDGWLAIWQRPDEIAAGREDIFAKAAEHGRSLEGFTVCSEQWLCLDDSREKAIAVSKSTRERFSSYLNELPHAGDDNVAGLLGREDEYSLLGNPDDVRHGVLRYKAAGADELTVRVIAATVGDAIASMESFKTVTDEL